jgi:hypothetical protein
MRRLWARLFHLRPVDFLLPRRTAYACYILCAMDQHVNLYPALLSFVSFGAVLILQRSKNHPSKKLWLISASEAYELRAFDEFHRIRREIGEDVKFFFVLHDDSNSQMYYRIELPSGRRDAILKESLDLALRKKVLVDFDPETKRKRQARVISHRRALQTRAKDWPRAIRKLVIEGKIEIDMTQEQVMVSWGKPDQINQSEGGWKVYEEWVYGSTYLYFEQGILRNYEERGVAQES